MPYINQVTMKDGSIRWAIKDRFTGKTMRNLDGPGFAYYLRKVDAEARFDDYCASIEREAM